MNESTLPKYNGFAIIAKAYRTALETPGADKAELRRHIKALDFLATCDKKDIYTLFDSGAFNAIVKGYLDILIDQADDLGAEQKAGLKQNLSGMFEDVSAEEAEAYFYK